MANEQSIFFKTPKQIKIDAKDALKGSYAKSIKANFLGLAILLATALAFVLSLILLEDFFVIQLTLCIIFAILFVFFTGTVLVGNLNFYNKLYKDDAKIKDALSSFNNIWKYGRMFVYYMLFNILAILGLVVVFGIIVAIIITSMANSLRDGNILEIFMGLINYTALFVVISCIFSIACTIVSLCVNIKYSMLFITVAETPKQTLISAFKENKKVIKGNKIRYFKLMFSLFPHYLLCAITFGIYSIWFVPYYQTCKVVFYQDLIAEF